MLSHSARVGDLVEVTFTGHEYYGLIGRIVHKGIDAITVDFFGKLVDVNPVSLVLKARIGSSIHKDLSEILGEKLTKHLTWSDLNELMNHALDVGEYQWAYALKQRRDSI